MGQNSAEGIARAYFNNEKVVAHYFQEGSRVGLWNSEETLFSRIFSNADRLLDLGCGTGRIAFGLESLGYTAVEGADFSKGMVDAALQTHGSVGSAVEFRQADARDLPWADEWFDGVIFGFNGFFMIPGQENRLRALKEIYRVLKPGGHFCFTGHDRRLSNQASYWSSIESEIDLDSRQKRDPSFGDVIAETSLGKMYIHSTTVEEAAFLLEAVGFKTVETWLRSELANESAKVREFSDECRFWVASK